MIDPRRGRAARRIVLAVAGLGTLAAGGPLQAHEVTWDDAREIESLATSVDKAIQACGVHASRFDPEKPEASPLPGRGISLDDQPTPQIAMITTSLGKSRYHRWLDPHAQIWLIASSERPMCRIAVAGSQWVDRIDEPLDKLIQVGNFWRPASESENVVPSVARSASRVYVMDTPERVPVRPLLIVTTPPPGTPAAAGQQMIITVSIMNKES